VPSQSAVFDAAKQLMTMMISRSEGNEVRSRDFTSARAAVLADPTGRKLAPECVRVCRDPDQVWAYVKSQDPELPSYASRRGFFQREFEELLSGLERFDTAPLDELLDDPLANLDSAAVEAAWSKALERRTTDPEGAITAARTLLESVCKTILDDAGEDYDGRDDLPKLYRKAAESLTLAPSDYSDEQIKRILGGATSVVEGVGRLRNQHGDAHGKGRRAYRLSDRHAALAVNMAGTVALFLMQTAEARQSGD
jgi:abortive infection Abi-like protein